jgi:hypothetical protein
MLDRILSVVVAVGLALLLWLYARSRDQEILDNVVIPVQLALAGSQSEQYNLETHGDVRVMVSFAGAPSRIRELRGILQRGELHVELTYNVPEDRLAEGRYADTILVEASDVHAPPGVTPIMVEGRNRIPITIHRLVEKRLPVRFDYGREESGGGRVIVEPATVLVRGPQEVLDRARFISTQPAALPPRPANAPPWFTAVGKVPLVQELENRPVRVIPDRVTIRAQARQLYELPDVPVHFLCPVGFRLRPEFLDNRSGHLKLKLWGPVQDEVPRVYAFVDLTRSRFTPGLNHEPLQLQLPKDFTLEQEPSRVVAFELIPADFIPRDLGTVPGP